MTAKGLAVLESLVAKFGSELFAYVVTAKDAAVEFDGFDQIKALAQQRGILVFERGCLVDELPCAEYAFAVSWRWLISINESQKLIVFHDSILPRYRGFAPLVSALINGDDRIGVTALFASHEYDAGPIVGQEIDKISYPITIAKAIELIVECYRCLAVRVMMQILESSLKAAAQNENKATYSLWRDDKDYRIDWTWDNARIRRFVDAVGYPYKGASTLVDGVKYLVMSCKEVPDVMVENRIPGKVIFLQEGKPIVVCGKGLLKILELKDVIHGADALPLKKLRIRFE